MKPTIEGRLTALEQAAAQRHPEQIRIVSGGCFTQEELDLIHEATGPHDSCLKPSVVVIVGLEMEKRPARPLAELLEQYHREV